MKAQVSSLCCLVLLLAVEHSHSRSKIHRKDGEKLQSPPGPGNAKPGRTQEGCHGSCVSSSTCSEPCAKHFRGQVGFTCHQNTWQKSTETCTSLSVEALFKDSSGASQLSLASSSIPLHILGFRAPQPIENVVQGILQHCPLDYSCIVQAVRSSEATSGNIAFVVELLKNISAHLSEDVTQEKMQSYSALASHVLQPAALSNWSFVPDRNASSDLLAAAGQFAGRLRPEAGGAERAAGPLFMQTRGARLLRNASHPSLTFSWGANRTAGGGLLGRIDIPRGELRGLPPGPARAVGVAFPTLGAVLGGPERGAAGTVLSVVLPERLQEVLLTFEKGGGSPDGPARCVGWHASRRAWDPHACRTVWDLRGQVGCCCRRSQAVTSFSILMSPATRTETALGYLTGAALGVSVLSLALCLLAEALAWSQVAATEISYLRHVCIVNIAASLLAADLWFLVGAHARIQSRAWCVAVAFFSHLSYLSAFFWMLFKALLIVYGVLVVFQRLLKARMLAAGFAVGYGCPLVIALTTVAVTQPQGGYLRCDACWLAWDRTKALLAFALPALAVVAVNLAVVLAVAVAAHRPSRGGAKARPAAAVLRVGKTVAVLTPLLGLTWGFGVATLVEGAPLAFHGIFALLNALQGFFILLFGTIMDHKIRDALRLRMASLRRRSRAAEDASLSPTNGSRLMNR
ncbi:LOW QUALITY PROTEIN: adhesion G protein-coupled receptor F4 [Dipodomys spectabilis]|uniref:LOW QUALITY PROTEIN: adhesion G protein-coupled receptor F4 n=1 Tax=Dipodomys spectabilis TaxID=105255 RepID=UPI001C54A8C0|nr:LOW QUALITY PROTEIN: adhesion G protein-coupled receptor F4 [Dipodomys spectabilis]